MKLSELPNIGSAVESQLNQVEIITFEDLKNAGAEDAWLRIQAIDRSACINRLMALEGAIQGVKKSFITESRKAELKAFYNAHKIKWT
ncbi:MAG: competence protein TfoX [Firmicutes bacterium HGW-Firmicutes-16]|nr:MAG: competence protein TfoX [Firmicutes bacterium HGW-Firmicutes-16]